VLLRLSRGEPQNPSQVYFAYYKSTIHHPAASTKSRKRGSGHRRPVYHPAAWTAPLVRKRQRQPRRGPSACREAHPGGGGVQLRHVGHLQLQRRSLATTVATSSMCSPKCLHRAVHAEKTLVIKPLQEFERIKDDRALVSICRVLDDFELLIHGISTPFFIEHRSVLSDSVEPQGCASKYWDPGLVVSDIVVDDGFAHQLWDPRSPGE
jgi:hypothetical protein